MMHPTTADIRDLLAFKFADGDIEDNGTVEILNAAFIADESTIFGETNFDYANRELGWYLSESLCVHDIEGKVPQIWLDISDKNGMINSNYGWCIFSKENGNQYDQAVACLKADSRSRQATMIYIRPTMHVDAVKNGMKDFMCTYSAQMFIRDGVFTYHVYMRSNDAVFGYKNDWHWHNHVMNLAYEELRQQYPDLKLGDMFWNAASIHVYPRHFKLIEEYNDQNQG